MTDDQFRAIERRFDALDNRLASVENEVRGLRSEVRSLKDDTYLIKAILGIANINPESLRKAVFPLETA